LELDKGHNLMVFVQSIFRDFLKERPPSPAAAEGSQDFYRTYLNNQGSCSDDEILSIVKVLKQQLADKDICTLEDLHASIAQLLWDGTFLNNGLDIGLFGLTLILFSGFFFCFIKINEAFGIPKISLITLLEWFPSIWLSVNTNRFVYDGIMSTAKTFKTPPYDFCGAMTLALEGSHQFFWIAMVCPYLEVMLGF